MTIDINELRKVIADCYWPTSPVTINSLLDQLEAAEKSDAESIAMYRNARDERDELRAKITEMERQEPTRDWWECLIADISAIDCMYRGSPTYAHDAYWMRDHVVWMLKKRRDALPGAKGEEK